MNFIINLKLEIYEDDLYFEKLLSIKSSNDFIKLQSKINIFIVILKYLIDVYKNLLLDLLDNRFKSYRNKINAYSKKLKFFELFYIKYLHDDMKKFYN